MDLLGEYYEAKRLGRIKDMDLIASQMLETPSFESYMVMADNLKFQDKVNAALIWVRKATPFAKNDKEKLEVELEIQSLERKKVTSVDKLDQLIEQYNSSKKNFNVDKMYDCVQDIKKIDKFLGLYYEIDTSHFEWDWDNAILVGSKLINSKIDDLKFDTKVLIARSYHAKGLEENDLDYICVAEEMFSLMLHDNKTSDIYAYYSQVLIDLEDIKFAKKMINLGLKLNKKNWKLYYNKARIAKNTDNKKQVIKNLEQTIKYLKIEDRFPAEDDIFKDAVDELYFLYEDENKKHELLLDVLKSFKNDPHFLIKLYEVKKKLDLNGTKDIYDYLSSQDYDDFYLNTEIAFMAMKQQDPDIALDYFISATKDDFAPFIAEFNLAQLFLMSYIYSEDDLQSQRLRYVVENMDKAIEKFDKKNYYDFYRFINFIPEVNENNLKLYMHISRHLCKVFESRQFGNDFNFKDWYEDLNQFKGLDKELTNAVINAYGISGFIKKFY